MERPDRNAPDSEWSKWADAHYPFDGRSAKGLTGFNVLRSQENPEMRARMAWALCQQYPDPCKPRDPLSGIPPMPDYGYGNLPEDTDPVQQPMFGDDEGIR